MSFPLFVSRKFTFSKKKSKFVSFISAISIIGIALGVATLIIALSILNGFERTITNKIIEFDSHIQITSYESTLPDYHNIYPKLKSELSGVVKEINPYESNLAIISSKKHQEGLNIKGVIPKDYINHLKDKIVDGKYDLTNGNFPTIIIGKKLANKLFVKVGDNVTVFALKNDKLPSYDNLPNIEKFKISGIFESGMSQYDDLFAYVDLKAAQELFSVGDNINGYDIKLKDISKIDSVTSYLNKEYKYPYVIKSIYQTHRNIFTWIGLQKKPIPIILGLIIIVAVFNIIATLLMIVLEKTNAIGTLKALGAKSKQIVFIFLYQGFFLALWGILSGNILAYLLMEIQLKYNIISLPSSVYFMSTVPIQLSLFNFLLVSSLTLLLAIIVSVLPSYIASKIKPITALRFN